MAITDSSQYNPGVPGPSVPTVTPPVDSGAISGASGPPNIPATPGYNSALPTSTTIAGNPITAPIPVGQTSSQPTLNLAPTITTPNTSAADGTVATVPATTKSVSDYISELTPPTTAADTEQQGILDSISALTGAEGNKGQDQANAESAAGIPGLKTTLQGLNNDLATNAASYNKQFSNLGSGFAGGESSAVLNAQSAGLKVAQAADIGLITAKITAAQGNLTLAQDQVNRAIDLKYSTIEAQLATKQAQLNALQPTLDKEDKVAAAAQQQKLTDDAAAVADEKQKVKDNLNLVLQSGAKTPFVNNNGTFFDARTGQTFPDQASFFKAAGVTSFDEAYQKGLITDVNASTLAASNFAAQAAAKYPDAGIKPTDSADQIAAKLKNSAIYRKDTYIAPNAYSNPSTGVYVPGQNPQVDSYITQVKNGNMTMAQVPTAYRGLVAEGLSGTSQSIIDPATDARVMAIIAANPGQYGNAATAIDTAFGAGTASKYDAQLKAVYNNGQDVGDAFNSGTNYSPLASSRFSTAANKIVANFINLPAYQLAAGGTPYVSRILAASTNPGSISDQELLDAFTKLSTSGNAISDAQVKLITGGKSFADTVNTLTNKFKNGGSLSDSQRQQIIDIAQKTLTAYQKDYRPIYNQATSQLKDAGIPEAFWTIPNLNVLSGQGSQSGSAPAGQVLVTDPNGNQGYIPQDQLQDALKQGYTQ